MGEGVVTVWCMRSSALAWVVRSGVEACVEVLCACVVVPPLVVVAAVVNADRQPAGLIESASFLQESTVLQSVLAEFRVVFQGANHPHHQVVAQENLVHGDVVEQHQPLENVKHVVQVLSMIKVLHHTEQIHELRDVSLLKDTLD